MVTVDVLPDDVLLTIFDFHADHISSYAVDLSEFIDEDTKIESWHSLVHVCRRWRGLVFASPRRLNIQLCCTTRTPARETLDIWPPLPLVIQGDLSDSSVDNVIAKLKLSDRICKIELNCHTTLQIEKLMTAMRVPFPELTSLYVSFRGVSYDPVHPDLSLGGSAPRLKRLSLVAVPLSGLPKSLLPATHLVGLWLLHIPHSGYISPEAMVTCLSMLTSLDRLQLEFESPQSCPDQENRRSPPPTRSVLPALTFFWFKGVNEYLEELVARIDTPRLCQLSATYFNDIDFDTPELIRFVSYTPKLGAYNEARLIFDYREALVRLRSPPYFRMVQVKILCRVSDWQLSSLAQICTLSLHFFLTMENLYIHENRYSPDNWTDDIENSEWLDLLLPFTAVKNLYVSKQFTPHIARALQEPTGGRTTEVLPALQNVLLEGFQPSEPVHEGIRQFVSARQLSSRPVAISAWERDYEQEDSY